MSTTESRSTAGGRRRRRRNSTGTASSHAAELPEGRVTTVTAGHHQVALTHIDGELRRAVEPLPAPGRAARRGHDRAGSAALPVARLRLLPADRLQRVRRQRPELRGRGARRRDSGSACPVDPPHEQTVSDVMAQTLVAWGVTDVFGMVGHSNLGPRRRAAPPRGGWRAALHRHPARGRRGLRRVGLRQADRPPRRLPDDRRPGRDEPAHRPVGRAHGRRAGARADRPGRRSGARQGRLPGDRPRRVPSATSRRFSADRPPRLTARRARGARGAPRRARARRRASRVPRRGPGPARARTPSPPRPQGRLPDLRIAPPADALEQAVELLAGAKRPAIIAGTGAHGRPRRRHRTRRAPRRAGDDDLPREGPDPRRPPARLRRARAQRHARRELDHERGRRAARDRRLVREPHRHLRRPPDRPRRPRPAPARPHDERRRAAARRRRRRGARARRPRCPRAPRTRPTRPPTSRCAARCGPPRSAAARRTIAAAASPARPCSPRSPSTRPTTP